MSVGCDLFFFFFLFSPYQTIEISLGQPSPPSYQLLPPPLGGSRRHCQGGGGGGGGGEEVSVFIPLRGILVHKLYSVA